MHAAVYVQAHLSTALYDIQTAPQGEMITEVLSTKQIIELVRLRAFL
jgi:hypothetical protein